MSDTAPLDVVFQRVEQMLDALEVSSQSSTDFLAGCDDLQNYLDSQAGHLTADQNLSASDKERIQSIIERLANLQKRAQAKARMPTDLQKYIAEQSD